MTIKEMYLKAQESQEYKDLLANGFMDLSSKRQRNNCTFFFRARCIECPYGSYNKLKKDYGVFKFKQLENGDYTFRVRTHMESQSQTKKEIEPSYESAFATLLNLHLRYIQVQENNLKKYAPMETTINATYVSVWDDGVVIRTPCIFDIEKRVAHDIVAVDIQGLDILRDEYVELPDGAEFRGFSVNEFDDEFLMPY